MNLKRKKIDILGVPIDSFDKMRLIRHIKKKLISGNTLFITTVNIEFLYRALQDEKIFSMLKKSSLNLADGVGVLWAAKYLSLDLPQNKYLRPLIAFSKLIGSLLAIVFYPKYLRSEIPEKISGSDFVWDLSRLAAENNFKVFFLGGGSTIPEQAALRLQTEIYNLKVAGTYEGSPKPEEEKNISRIISKSGAEILFIAYGVPAEELWLERNLAKTKVRIGIGVGGTFDFLAGRTKRAPKFFQYIGLEWLWRLILEPKRIKRQLALPKFIKTVFIHRLKEAC
jgi:N-acetylglucosaminyldiphosphoundecaprenol N-acetyl-beta-D-mannosaminyltransferase